MTNDLLPHATIAGSVGAFNAACQLVKEAEEKIKQAEELEKHIGQYCHINNSGRINIDSKSIISNLTKQAWHDIMRRIGATEYASATRRKELTRQIDEGTAPEYNVANIEATIQTMADNMPSMFSECVKEVFQWLKPGTWRTLKTQLKSKYEIQEKVIVNGLYSSGYFGGLNRYCRDYVKSLDVVFSLLAGKGLPAYPNDLPTQLEEAMRDKQKYEFENDFFYVRWYKNGNAHITFRRADLLSQLNSIATDGKAIRPDLG